MDTRLDVPGDIRRVDEGHLPQEIQELVEMLEITQGFNFLQGFNNQT